MSCKNSNKNVYFVSQKIISNVKASVFVLFLLIIFFVFLKINTCLLTKKEQSPSDMPTNQSDLDNFLMSLLSQVILDCVKLTIKAILKGIHSFLVLSIEAFGTFFILIALRTSHLQNDSRGKTT